MATYQLNKIEDRLDEISKEISEMNKTLAVNTKQLEIHIEGVKLAREQNDILKNNLEAQITEIKDQFKPINKHITFVKGAMWTVSIISASIYALHEMGILQKLALLIYSP